MKRSLNLIAAGVLVSLFVACKPQERPVVQRVVQSIDDRDSDEPSVISTEVAIVKTVYGEMVLEFWPDVAPKTVANFIKLAKAKFYDGTAFHRVVKGFMIQGGCPNTRESPLESPWGAGGPGYTIGPEFGDRKHLRGVVSMGLRPGDVNSAGSQFFICLDEKESLDGSYTAFGRLIRGDDVLEALGAAPTKAASGGEDEKSFPIERLGVETIRIVPRDTLTENSTANINPHPKEP